MATALRWLDKLKQKGLIVRSKDALDARRIFISLSKDGLERMDGYFENLAATRLVDRGQHP
jgi:DNA-binding MarR family transcriptional regulator